MIDIMVRSNDLGRCQHLFFQVLNLLTGQLKEQKHKLNMGLSVVRKILVILFIFPSCSDMVKVRGGTAFALASQSKTTKFDCSFFRSRILVAHTMHASLNN